MTMITTPSSTTDDPCSIHYGAINKSRENECGIRRDYWVMENMHLFSGNLSSNETSQKFRGKCNYDHFIVPMPLSSKSKTSLIIAIVTLIFDSMNNSIITPIMPYLLKELNSTTFQQGLLFSSYSVMQFLSIMFMGRYSDIYGRKPFLIMSLIGSCFGSILQGLSRNMVAFIIFRSLTGLFAGSLILVQTMIADLVTPEERSVWLTRLESFNSIAYIIGPALGGLIRRFPIGALVMIYMSCRKDRQLLGKKGMVPEQRDIEMQPKEDNKVEATATENTASPTIVAPAAGEGSETALQSPEVSSVQIVEPSAETVVSPQ